MKFEDMNPLQRRLHNAAIVLDAEGDEHGFAVLLREAIAAEEAQGVEPVAYRFMMNETEVWQTTTNPLVKAMENTVVVPLFTRPSPPPAGERAALIAQHRARAESAKLRGPNYSPCISADELLELLDMLAADAQEIRMLRDEIDHVKQVEFPAKVQKVAEGWRKKVNRLESQQVAVPQVFTKCGSAPLCVCFDKQGLQLCNCVQNLMREFDAEPPPPQADALAADHVEDARAMVPMTENQIHHAKFANSDGSTVSFAREIEQHNGILVKP